MTEKPIECDFCETPLEQLDVVVRGKRAGICGACAQIAFIASVEMRAKKEARLEYAEELFEAREGAKSDKETLAFMRSTLSELLNIDE